jgi:hypothetical protein
VAGKTISVRDPADVRALYERGRAAVARAQAAALRALEAVIVDAGGGPGAWLILPFAIAPVGTAADIASEVFAADIDARLQGAVMGLPGEPLLLDMGFRERYASTLVAQDSVLVETSPERVHSWRLRVAWDGSAAGMLSAGGRQDEGDEQLLADAIFDAAVRPLASVVEETARSIGGYGRAHIAFRPIAWRVSVIRGQLTRSLPDFGEVLPIQRWADGEPWVDELLLESMKRELLRACGLPEWEPGESE